MAVFRVDGQAILATLRDDLPHNPRRFDARQPLIEALESEVQARVIEAEQMQDCGVQIVHVDAVARDVEAEFVALTQCDARFDATTGKELWRHAWPSEIRNMFHGGGTLTTPSIEGHAVYVTTRQGLAFAFDVKNGQVLWTRNYLEELELKMTFHGFSASPLVRSEDLILVLGGTVLSVDKTNGDVLWRTENHGDGGYANPAPFELDGEPRLAVFAGVGLLVLDGRDGKELFRFPWKSAEGGVNACTPIVMGRKIFISSAYGMGAAMLELGDTPEPTVLWQSKRLRNKVSGCLLWNDHLYGFDESMLKCFDLEGNEKWRERGLGMGSIAIAGGRLIVLSSKGGLLVAEATPEEFRELSRRDVLEGGVYWTAPVLLDGRIYCRNSLGELVCLDHRAPPAATGVATSIEEAADATQTLLPEADALFSRYAEAVGATALRERRSMHIEGAIEILGAGITRSPMTLDLTAPDAWRLHYSLGQFGEVARCYDGEISWELDPFYGDKLHEGDELRAARLLRSLHAPAEWGSQYKARTTTGRTTFADRDCWVVVATMSDDVQRTVYFDVEGGHLVGHEGATEPLVVYADWQTFDGVELPAKTTILLPETGAEETYYVEAVTWDSVDPQVYERPPAVLRLLRTPQEIEAENEVARERYAEYLGAYHGDIPPEGKTEWRLVVEDGHLAIRQRSKSLRGTAFSSTTAESCSGRTSQFLPAAGSRPRRP